MRRRIIKQIQAATLDAGVFAPSYTPTPSECPRCHTNVYPRTVLAVLIGDLDHQGSSLQIAFHCTNVACQELFIGYYDLTNEEDQVPHIFYLLTETAPTTPVKAVFSDSISAVSPNFEEIYNQAIAAEAAGLDQITGIGLRKALEFLIKDFAITQRPADTEAIQRCQLAQCINNYVADTNVKTCAARATWLGNDETHYIRKWVDKDINDLKTLIKLTVNWIDNVLLTEQYLKTMNP